MADQYPRRPEPEAEQRGARPLSRRRSKLFVIAAILIAIGISLLTIYTLVRTANDPGVQQGIEEYRRDTGQLPSEGDRNSEPRDTLRE